MARPGTVRVSIDPTRPHARRPKATDPLLAADLGRRLCEVFGLTAERTRRITIELEAGQVAEVTVDQLVTTGQADELLEVATRYGLHRADPVRQLHPGFTIRDLP